MRRLLPLVALVVLAGCGSERTAEPVVPSPAARTAATQAAVAYVRAITTGGADQACALLTAAAAKQLADAGHPSCRAYVTVVRRDLPRSPALRQVSLRDFTDSMRTAQAVGSSSRLRLVGDGLPEGGLPLELVRGKWLLAAAF